MALDFSVPQRTFNAGQQFGPMTFAIPIGAIGMQIVFTNPSGWPLGDIATITIEISYDNGASWELRGGLKFDGNTQGLTDQYIGLISGATLKANFPKPATSTTLGRAAATVLQTFTTSISVSDF